MPETLDQRLASLVVRLERITKHLETTPAPAGLLRTVDKAKAEAAALAEEVGTDG